MPTNDTPAPREPRAAYQPPPLNCPHGRQTTICAICAPAAEADYAVWAALQDSPAPRVVGGEPPKGLYGTDTDHSPMCDEPCCTSGRASPEGRDTGGGMTPDQSMFHNIAAFMRSVMKTGWASGEPVGETDTRVFTGWAERLDALASPLPAGGAEPEPMLTVEELREQVEFLEAVRASQAAMIQRLREGSMQEWFVRGFIAARYTDDDGAVTPGASPGTYAEADEAFAAARLTRSPRPDRKDANA